MNEDDFFQLQRDGHLTFKVTMHHRGVEWSKAAIVLNPDDRTAESIRHELLTSGEDILKIMSGVWQEDDPKLRFSTINGNKKAEVKSE